MLDRRPGFLFDKYHMEEKNYTTTIPRLSDLNRERRLAGRAMRQRRYKHLQTHSGEVAQFYSSPAWRNLRDVYVRQHPVCELSLLEHRVMEAQEVHHIVKWADQQTDEMKWQLLLDADNLISLTRTVHQYIHYAQDKLTEEQRLLLLQRRQAIEEKYLALGLPIVMPPDENR